MKRLLLIFALLVSCPDHAHALLITLNQSSSVDDKTITLGDIATFDEQSDLTRALATQQIGQAPPPGESLQLRSIRIKQYLVAREPALRDASWQGPPTVTVHRRGVTVGPDQIQSAIDDYIMSNRNNLPAAEVRFIPNALPLPFKVPTGSLTHEVFPSNPGIIGSSRFSIIFRVDDQVVNNMSVRGRTEALAQVVVSAKLLKKGDHLAYEDLTTAVVDISKFAGGGDAIEDFVGKRLKRNLRAGDIVLASMVETPPVVRRGERVKIVIQTGQLLLTATGLAHTDGGIDEMIRVKNISSNKTIYCRVAAPGLVEVLL